MATIGQLIAQIKHDHCPMAVVDYIGRMITRDGKIVKVEAGDPDRYGVRSLRHVFIYDFPVIWKNDAAIAYLDAGGNRFDRAK